MPLTLFSPAKLNLFLAITGRRADGFHALVSVVTPLEWGDTLTAEIAEGSASTLTCDDPAVPTDGTNLVLKAAQVFCRETGSTQAVRFALAKRIPMGAGLGGGSSNGAMALRALNTLAGNPVGASRLAALASELGSDCALFLEEGAVAMRGRGERVERLPTNARERIAGQRVLVMKPAFGVSTAWAYGRMAAQAAGGDTSVYWPESQAEAQLTEWISGGAPLSALLFNNMEPAAFTKFVALPELRAELKKRFGLALHMSGSGSACFALLDDSRPADAIAGCVREAWGPSALVVETRCSRGGA